MEESITRRKFIQTAAVGGAALTLVNCAAPNKISSYQRISGANDRIRIGQIGCGNRGIRAHIAGIEPYSEQENIEVVAICDPWRLAREEAAAKVKEVWGREPQQFVSYRDLLELKDIDAVMIASCDFQHTTHLEAAALAGKDVYVEKPLGMEIEKVIRACDAVDEAGIVAQVGTQLRSLPTFTGCRELYQTGILGKVGRIEQCRNSTEPYWYPYLKEVKEDDVDWQEFLMDRPMRPFDSNLYSGWYGYRDFSDGPVPGWGSHYIDLVHFITGAKLPQSCVCMGGTFTWKDDYNFTCPDHVQAMWIYPEGFMVSYSTNFGNGYGNSFKIYGDQGVLKMEHWGAPVYTAEGGSKNKGIIRGENEVKEIERPDHYLDWLQCLRSRQRPHAPIEAGYQHAVAVIMAMMSYDSGKRIEYDAVQRTVTLA